MTFANLHHTGYVDLLADAIFQWRASDSNVPRDALPEGHSNYRMNRHARASISASMLSFECAANCLVDALDVSSAAKNDIDKLSSLAKFELYARIQHQKEMSRGDVGVARMVDLVRARNAFVHAKTKALPMEFDGVKDGGDDWVVGLKFLAEQWTNLEIPRDALFWSADDARTTIRAVCAFMKWYFSELLGMPPKDVSQILFSTITYKHMVTNGVNEDFFDELRAARGEFSDLSFVHILEPLELTRQAVLQHAQKQK